MLHSTGIGRFSSPRVLIGLMATTLMMVVSTGVASANHGGATLDVDAEKDVTLVGKSTPLAATLSEPPSAPVTVNFEITGANDLVPNPTCTTPATDNPGTTLDERTQCKTSYSGTMPGTDTIRGFISDAAVDTTEGQPAATQPGEIPEPDQTDVVTREWFQELPPGTTLDCSPETATNPATGEGSSETYNCTVRGPEGTGTAGVWVDGENLNGANDNDDSAAAGNADYNNQCKTGESGDCAVTVLATGEAGDADICFWIDDNDSREFNPGGAEYNGGKCDEEARSAPEDDNKTDVVTKTWKFPRSVSLSRSASTVTFGRFVTLSGSISSDPSCSAGTNIAISRNVVGDDDGGFKAFKTVTTGSAGGYSLAFQPGRSASYKAHVDETDKCFGDDSGSISVMVRKRVALTLSDNSVRRGQVVKFTASVAPCSGHQGDVVQLFKKVSGAFKQVAQKSTGSSCSAVFKKTIKSSGTYLARSPQQDQDHLGGQSPAKTVTVR